MLYRKTLYVALAAIVAVGIATSAQAQGPRQGGPGQGGFGRGGFGGGFGGGFNDPFSLVNNPAIRSELGIDDSQAEKLRELRQQLDAEVDAARQKVTAQFTEKLNDVLLPHQVDRLLGITVQLRGPAALQDPVIAKRIGLTDAQQKEIAAKLEALNERNRTAFRGQDGERPDREALQARFQELRQERENVINSVLTADQKKKLDELRGEEFDRSQLFQRRDGDQGGRGRGRGGNN